MIVLSKVLPPIASFFCTTLSLITPFFHPFVPNPISSQNFPPHCLPAPISSGHGPQRDERCRVFACKPDPAFGTALAKGFDVSVQIDFAFFVFFINLIFSVFFFVRGSRGFGYFRVDVAVAAILRGADLEIGITAPSRELIMLPVCTEDFDWLTVRRRRVVIWQERVIRVKERGKGRVVLQRAKLERRD